MNRPAVMLMCALALSSAACESKVTAPEGEPSTVTVRAYVDANGSGVFDAGDTPISGVAIALKNSASDDFHSATTDAAGLATFSAIPAGSYTASVSGNAPAGAVLATASTPIVIAPISGGTIATEFRFAFNPGTVSGTLFRDNNANGTFDTGDTPAPGITVRLFAGTDTTKAPVATTATNAAGEYTFSTLRPGTYTAVFTPFPTIQIVGGNTQAVTVGAAGTTTANVRFTGNLIGSVEEARSKPANGTAQVAIEGTVIAGTGVFNARSFYVQDASGAILVFGVDTAAIKPQPGDRVRVIGLVSAFNQELQLIGNAQAPLVVTKIGTAPVPAPRPVSVADINALRFQGELAKVGNVTVTAVSGTATSTAYNVTVRDVSGLTTTVRVAGTGVGIPQTFWQVGTAYDVAGIMIRFNTTGQIAPRSPADVNVTVSGQTIAQARANNPLDSATVTVEGVVTAGTGNFNARSLYMQDATGGILVFGVDTAAVKPQPGARIRVTGKVIAFNGELEIIQPVITVLGTEAVPAPRNVTGADVNALNFQGELAKVTNVQVTAVSGSATSTSYNVTVTDGTTTFVIRVANAGIGIPQTFWTVGSRYDVTGIMIRFNAQGQLLVRRASDVVAR